jgi:hypothetical protein
MLLVAVALLGAPAFASETDHKLTTQQGRMATCAHESKGMKADERHRFMSECLKSHPSPDGAHSLSARADEAGAAERAKGCNVEAAKKDLHGDERRAFLASCVKG